MTDLIEQCPKFARCSAPVCPLYEKWQATRHLPGEAACLYLREAGKAGGEARLRGTLPGELLQPILLAYHAIVTEQRTPHGYGFGGLRRILIRSGKSGSKLAQGERLRTGSPPADVPAPDPCAEGLA